jgi:hypothetical protein
VMGTTVPLLARVVPVPHFVGWVPGTSTGNHLGTSTQAGTSRGLREQSKGTKPVPGGAPGSGTPCEVLGPPRRSGRVSELSRPSPGMYVSASARVLTLRRTHTPALALRFGSIRTSRRGRASASPDFCAGRAVRAVARPDGPGAALPLPPSSVMCCRRWGRAHSHDVAPRRANAVSDVLNADRAASLTSRGGT